MLTKSLRTIAYWRTSFAPRIVSLRIVSITYKNLLDVSQTIPDFTRCLDETVFATDIRAIVETLFVTRFGYSEASYNMSK